MKVEKIIIEIIPDLENDSMQYKLDNPHGFGQIGIARALHTIIFDLAVEHGLQTEKQNNFIDESGSKTDET